MNISDNEHVDFDYEKLEKDLNWLYYKFKDIIFVMSDKRANYSVYKTLTIINETACDMYSSLIRSLIEFSRGKSTFTGGI